MQQALFKGLNVSDTFSSRRRSREQVFPRFTDEETEAQRSQVPFRNGPFSFRATATAKTGVFWGPGRYG